MTDMQTTITPPDKKLKLAPGPTGLDMLRYWPIVAKEGLQAFFARLAGDYGDHVYFELKGKKFFVTSRPEEIEHVLAETGKDYRKGYAETLGFVGNGLLTSEGEFWRRQRRLAAPAFHHKRIAAYADVMTRLTADITREWHDGQTLDVHEEMMRLTLAIVCKTLFGEDINDRSLTVGRSIELLFDGFVKKVFYPQLLPKWVPTPRRIATEKAFQNLNSIISAIIEEHKNSVDKSDLLSMLMEARDDDGSAMTDEQLRDETMTLFIAGHETTASMLSWTWLLLSQHPEVRRKVCEEADSVLQGHMPTFEDVPRLPFADAVIKESMRLYPPAWRVTRKPLHDVELGGYLVPEDTVVFMSSWFVQRDARNFPNPERFAPERWLSDETKDLPKCAYFPFGSGPRTCIGNNFAIMEGVIILAQISQSFQIDVSLDARVVPYASITLRPKFGLKAKLTRRRRAVQPNA